MTKLSKLILMIAAAGITACSSGGNPTVAVPDPAPAVDTFKVQVLHASPDAPAVNVSLTGPTSLSGGDLSGLDYKAGTRAIEIEAGSYDVQVDGITPDGPLTVIGPANIPFAADTLYTVVAVGDVATIAPVILEQPSSAPDAGNARLRVLHAAPLAPQVDVYATTPGADLAASAPVGSFSFTEDLGPVQVPAGDYQIRVTLQN
ncbi:MAG: DUF4397 domain-containing protein, partial [Gammaproteobacteria bacterium]|nr:DUF4397 domain-containing protein [Gammaproteobacteria bacterium]